MILASERIRGHLVAALGAVRRRPPPRRLPRIALVGGALGAAAVLTAALALVLAPARGRARRGSRRPGGNFEIIRCPVHGIAYDLELEECTECAKAWPLRAGASLRG